MRINSISSVQNNISFNRVNTKTGIDNQHKPMSLDDKISLGAQCLAVVGIAGATALVLKENNINLVKIAKRTIRRIGKAFEPKQQNDTILELLDGKRDSEGVKIYRTYISGIKRKSLAQKFLNGELVNKDAKAFHKIAENSIELQRITGAL